MDEFDNIIALKNGKEKTEKLTKYYKENIKINLWLKNEFNKSIIKFKDRIEYKKFNKYHRLNGPAIDYNDEEKNKYYYRGKLYESKKEWKQATIKELRKMKIKKLNKSTL